ncbi:MAG TPA: TonB-dependent receptor plug domain-containing protein, partial [Rhodocyclaceae bacterium]
MSLKHRPLSLGIALLFAAPAALAVNASVELETPTITVIGTTPLPGIGVPIEKVPANVQSRSGKQVQQQQTLDLSEHLTQNIPGVVSSPSQDNPWQSDISFRGFVASPLQGAPQGLSVFLDGVRINEAFGDTVNWDLLPPNALAAANLMPGSNPVFGLNTLGGALSLVTKSGFRNPGGNIEVTAGSWGRIGAQFEHGGHDDDNDYFVAGNFSREDGWREHSPSKVKQLFAKVGHETEGMDLDVSLLLADNRLYGTQALPISMLDNPRQGYTWPDRTDNRLSMLSGHGSRFLDDKRLVSWGAYLRRLESTNVSSNSNENFDPLLPATIANAQGSMDRSLTESSTWG